MSSETIFIIALILFSVGFSAWRKRKMIIEWYKFGWNMACVKAGLPIYKEKKKE